MAIYERDRDFQKIFSQINVDVVPVKFIQDITCYLSDGSKIVLDQTDFRDDQDSDLEKIIRDLEFYEMLTDLKIRIDYEKVEQDVGNEVAKILKDQ